MSERNRASADEIRELGEKLVAFKETLGPRERELFVALLRQAREAMSGEVGGYGDQPRPADDFDATGAGPIMMIMPPNVFA